MSGGGVGSYVSRAGAAYRILVGSSAKHVLVPSTKKHKKFVFRLDADLGQIVWESVSKQQKISKWLLFLSYIRSANEDSPVRLQTGLTSYVARVFYRGVIMMLSFIHYNHHLHGFIEQGPR